MHACSIGYGRRLGVWMQGCTLACPGCSSQDTWRSGPARQVEWDFFASMLGVSLSAGPFDGVTISGGEPFQQRPGLAALVREIREIEKGVGADWDVLLYTGHEFGEVAAERTILDHVDLVVAGRFDRERPRAALRGSDNQTLHRLSASAWERYSDEWLDGPGSVASMDVSLSGGDLVVAGIAAQGDYPRLEEALAERGVTFKAKSWGDGR